MGTQNTSFNTHLPRGTQRPSFSPVTSFHRPAQKTFQSTKRGKWGALHVCIAWRIYYHKQLRKMQQKSNSLHQEQTPEHPAASLPDPPQHKELDRPSCNRLNLDSLRGKAAESVGNLNRSYPSDLYTPSPASCHSHMTKREKLDWEKLEQFPNLHWREKLDEKEKHGGHQTDMAKDLPLRDKSWPQAVTPELDRRHVDSLDRKRQLECDSFIRAKRAKQESVDSSKTLHPQLHPSSRITPVQHMNISNLSVLHPNRSKCNVTRTPGGLISYPESYPLQTASWEPMWDVHKRMDLYSRQHDLKDCSQTTCRIPPAAQRHKEAFHGFLSPTLYLPLALRQQETVYLGGRELLHSRQESCHLHRCRHQLPHPGFLAASYLGP